VRALRRLDPGRSSAGDLNHPSILDADMSTMVDIAELTPLLSDDELYLSEIDIDGEVALFHMVGCAAAELHSKGVVHGDFHPGNIMFDARTCRITLIDLSETTFGPVDPDRAFIDILALFGRVPREAFAAFLAGYVQCVFSEIEPATPGYLRKTLQYVGGVIKSFPIGPNPASLLADILQNISTDMSADGRLRLTPSDVSFVRYIRAEELWDLCLLLAIFRFGGAPFADIQRLVDEISTVDRSLGSLVTAIMFGPDNVAHLPGMSINDPRFQLYFDSIRLFSQADCGDVSATQNVLAGILRECAGEGIDAASAVVWIDKILFCMLHLAALFAKDFQESGWRTRDDTSATVTQFAEVLMQATFRSRDLAGSASVCEQRHVLFRSWKTRIAWHPSRTAVLSAHAPRSLLGTLNSEALTDSCLFDFDDYGSGGRFWSAALRARNTYQSLLGVIAGVSESGESRTKLGGNGSSSRGSDTEIQIASAVVGGYATLLRQMIMNSIAVPMFVQAWLTESDPSMESDPSIKTEALWAAETFGVLRDQVPADRKWKQLKGVETFLRRSRS
jgi:Phosphotransferase enzyme family